jgi:peptide deformylase
MTNRTVVKNPSEILRRKSEPVSRDELARADIQMLIDDLIVSMRLENGIGIAAPQIGVHKRIIIVDNGGGPTAYINPEIIGHSIRKGHYIQEGCLSVPGMWGYVTRHKAVKVRALARDGEQVSLKARDLLSVIFQHEIDHLDGILFIDKADTLTRHPGM